MRALPCLQSAPYDEKRRDRLQIVSPTELRLRSSTTREDCYAEDPTKSLVMEIQAQPDAVLTIELARPSQQSIRTRLKDLIEDNVVEFTGVFTSESLILHRLIGPADYQATIRWQDRNNKPDGNDWYYVRVTQHNGHMAWSSPIWA